MMIYDLKKLASEVGRPYYPDHPDYVEGGPTGPQWTLEETVRQLVAGEREGQGWVELSLNRLRCIGYVVPNYIQHPLVTFLAARGAVKIRAVK